VQAKTLRYKLDKWLILAILNKGVRCLLWLFEQKLHLTSVVILMKVLIVM